MKEDTDDISMPYNDPIDDVLLTHDFSNQENITKNYYNTYGQELETKLRVKNVLADAMKDIKFDPHDDKEEIDGKMAIINGMLKVSKEIEKSAMDLTKVSIDAQNASSLEDLKKQTVAFISRLHEQGAINAQEKMDNETVDEELQKAANELQIEVSESELRTDPEDYS